MKCDINCSNITSKISNPLFSALGLNAWNSIAGLLNAVLIIYLFSKENQGLYYTITSITAIKVIFDAGFSNVIIAYVSHHKNKILVDNIVTFKEDGFEKLSNVFNYSRKRYRVVASIGFIVLQLCALFFFKDLINTLSIFYWLLISLFFAINLIYIPYFSVLEGLDLLTSIFNFRLRSSLISYLASWGVMLMGGGVLCLLVTNAVMLVNNVVYVRKYKNLFEQLKQGSSDGGAVRSQVSSFSAKINVSFFTGYLLNNGIVPLIFKYIGSSAAGSYGLTWSLFSVISVFPKQLIFVIRPKLGSLFSENRYKEMWNLFINRFAKAILLFLFMNIIVLLLADAFSATISNRILGTHQLYLMSSLFVILNVKGYYSYFFRAQLKDPLYIHDTLASVLVIIFIFLSESMTLENILLSIIFSYGVFNFIGIFHHTRIFFLGTLSKS